MVKKWKEETRPTGTGGVERGKSARRNAVNRWRGFAIGDDHLIYVSGTG